jgi:DNA-binding CsgD family transcriptional regulator
VKGALRVDGGKGQGKKRRSYRPTVEALEALRMLSDASAVLPDLPPQGALLAPVPLDTTAPQTSNDAWDAALGQTLLSDLLAPAKSPTDASAISSGLSQLNRYLSRTWFRAGVPVQMHDDCSQAVYLTLLQNLGRDRFDSLLVDIGQAGIRDVLSRETADGPDFFRAIDTVKKRAQRERTFQPLESIPSAAVSSGPADTRADWRGALQEAIDQSLSPREAALVYATLKGETPAEIAAQWGVAPKTVSNEKTRVIQKLRDALVADLSD